MLKALCLLMLVFGFGFEAVANKPRKLVFLTWEDFISPSVVTKFEEEFNAKVEFAFFQHDEERDELIASEMASRYDVYIVDGQSVESHRKFNWMAPLTIKDVPNLDLYNSQWKKITPESVGYGVPYGWGTFGIAYRADKIKQPPTSLKALFHPPDELKGKITMSPQMFELVPSALLALGFDMNSRSLDELGQAENLIFQQKPFVHSYQLPQLNNKSILLTDDVWVSQTYNGDALILADLNQNIKYLVPQEGSPLWVDYLAVSVESQNKDLAYLFVNYMSRTEVILENMQFTYTASFNDVANQKLPKEIRDNPMIFHPLDKLFYYRPADTRTARKMMSIIQNLDIN